jgi:hypothetical protein
MGFLHKGLMPPYQGTTLLGGLAGIINKPRNRSEWEDRFTHWQRPASETEAQKIETARSRVVQALRRSTFLPTRSWEIIPQGSYHNRTNVRQDSDVDLCVCLTDVFFWDQPPGAPRAQIETGMGFTDLNFTFVDYKNHIAKCIGDEFGAASTETGNKAIQLHKDDDTRISVDVVPAYLYRQYGTATTILGGWPVKHAGIGLVTNDGERKINFPIQHYENGCTKNDRTKRRYKRVVRILKRLRNHIDNNGTTPQDIKRASGGTPSFLIESLVYNCPDNLFGATSIYDDVVAVLKFLDDSFKTSSVATILLGLNAHGFKEVNGIKDLFGTGQAWSFQDAHAFVLGVRLYMEV